MLIKKNKLAQYKNTIKKLNNDLDYFSDNHTSDERKIYSINISILLDKPIINWSEIKWLLTNSHKSLEDLLFRIHFKRNKLLTKQQRTRLLHFLSLAYLNTNDVRYLNEFLFFYQENIDDKKYLFLMSDLFYSNINSNNCHRCAMFDKQEVEEFIQDGEKKANKARNKSLDQSLRIGLMGSPTFFKKIKNNLNKKGLNIFCYFIPFHPDKKIRFLLKNRILFSLFCLTKRINFKFLRLDYHHKDPRIEDRLKNEKLDIGFHKLGFIIKNNIINSFKYGLINDHWAALPYIRGLSSIEYSLLLDIPVVATCHLIEESVDSGNIISFYKYYDIKEKKYSKISQIRQLIRKEREFRAIDSIDLMSRTKKTIMPNNPNKGLMFYSIHPSLKKYIEDKVLTRA